MDQVKSIPVVRCAHCGTLAIPPQYVCENCQSTHFDRANILGRGKVYSHTTIRVAPEGFQNQVPYKIALVDLKPRLRITARIVQDEEREIDVGEDLIFDRVDQFGYWFRVAPK